MCKKSYAVYKEQSFSLQTVIFATYFVLISFMLSVVIVAQATTSITGPLIIDPGHSPDSPGATSCTGKPEYLYNAYLAETVVSSLRKHHMQVTLTRQRMEAMSLKDRALAAKGKCLILSLHHDSVQPQFVTWDKKGRPFSSKAKGFSIFISRKNKYYLQALSDAHNLGTALLRRGLMPTLHHAEKIVGENRQLVDSKRGIYFYDNLFILRKSDAPAILLEAAVIVNPRDELLASSKMYRMKIAEAIEEMMVSRCGSKNVKVRITGGNYC